MFTTLFFNLSIKVRRWVNAISPFKALWFFIRSFVAYELLIGLLENGVFGDWYCYSSSSIIDITDVSSYDIILNNNVNFYTLSLILLVCWGFVLFLFLQANLLNLSFYPNATFDAEKYSPYECGFTPFRTE